MCNDCERRCECKGREALEQLADIMELENPYCKGYIKEMSEEEEYKRIRESR